MKSRIDWLHWRLSIPKSAFRMKIPNVICVQNKRRLEYKTFEVKHRRSIEPYFVRIFFSVSFFPGYLFPGDFLVIKKERKKEKKKTYLGKSNLVLPSESSYLSAPHKYPHLFALTSTL